MVCNGSNCNGVDNRQVHRVVYLLYSTQTSHSDSHFPWIQVGLICENCFQVIEINSSSTIRDLPLGSLDQKMTAL